ncbi:hypothetical protein H257_09863 [Aphanomyces astaci]|uniref:Uncharacterized protein n=1 Tax=Aphanomyces astaci TaxID=112090 RepID=W4GAB8_APHAT|nr:hypothetical protein H257_09863 [Aphanomyces astaci]ETV75898.1 hypothetical protein H257_09863 [Aphanomyces astaci]|eukprot:XP_009834540.1 hypothetical protein H257_09863 [Aphanomyces astaci]
MKNPPPSPPRGPLVPSHISTPSTGDQPPNDDNHSGPQDPPRRRNSSTNTTDLSTSDAVPSSLDIIRHRRMINKRRWLAKQAARTQRLSSEVAALEVDIVNLE